MKRKNRGNNLDGINELQCTASSVKKSVDGKSQPGFNRNHLLSHNFKSPHTQIKTSSPFSLVKPHHIGSFLPLNHNTINSFNPPLSSFKSLSSHSPSREIAPGIMESNTSSPHSSNSITQPPLLPLTPYHTQNIGENTPQINIHVPFEEYNEQFQQDVFQGHVNSNDLRNSWENSIGPNSLSSFFNFEDALFRGDPLFEPFSISDPLDWGKIQNFLQGQSSNISPQTPLQIPGSHSSLQTGSSSSFHSAVAGLSASEFADLRIFPVWQNYQGPAMDLNAVKEKSLGKRKFEELNEVLDSALKAKEILVEVPVKSSLGFFQEVDGSKPTEELNVEQEVDARVNLKSNSSKAAAGPKETKEIVSSVQPKPETGPITGNELKTMTPNVY